jgi:hypothetical protein
LIASLVRAVHLLHVPLQSQSSLVPISPTVNRTASGSTIPPPPPPKDAIRSREELIIEKRREARRREENENAGYWTPPRHSEAALSKGRPSRRRSQSTGDMEELVRRSEKNGNRDWVFGRRWVGGAGRG